MKFSLFGKIAKKSPFFSLKRPLATRRSGALQLKIVLNYLLYPILSSVLMIYLI